MIIIYLLADYALSCAALTPFQHVSLLLASDPRHHLSGQDRDQWTRELAPLAASFAIALRSHLLCHTIGTDQDPYGWLLVTPQSLRVAPLA